MKKILYILAGAMMMASCSSDTEPQGASQVTIEPRIPVEISRAAADLNVNKVVCGVFKDGREIGFLREVIDVTDNMTYTPTLVIGDTYTIVFWALKEGAYNVADLTAVTANRSAASQESDFDAFTASAEITVSASDSRHSVTLKRPLAHLTLASTTADYAAATSLGYTLRTINIDVAQCYDAYNALAGTPTGNLGTASLAIPISGEAATLGGTPCNILGSAYLFAQSPSNVTYSVVAEKNSDHTVSTVVENLTINQAPLLPNYNTNIVGDLLTGSYSYSIELEASHDE